MSRQQALEIVGALDRAAGARPFHSRLVLRPIDLLQIALHPRNRRPGRCLPAIRRRHRGGAIRLAAIRIPEAVAHVADYGVRVVARSHGSRVGHLEARSV